MSNVVNIHPFSCSWKALACQSISSIGVITLLALCIISVLGWIEVNVGPLSFLVMDPYWTLTTLILSLIILLVQMRYLLVFMMKGINEKKLDSQTSVATFPATTTSSTIGSTSSSTSNSLPMVNAEVISLSSTTTNADLARCWGLNYFLDGEDTSTEEKVQALTRSFMETTLADFQELIKLDLFAPYYESPKSREGILIERTLLNVLNAEFKENYYKLPAEQQVLEEQLCDYVKKGKIGMVSFLLSVFDFDVNMVSDFPYFTSDGTLLSLAAYNGDQKMVKLLLIEFGANPNIIVNYRTSIYWAVRFPSILDLLFDHGAILDFKPGNYIESPLDCCIVSLKEASARLLLSKGAKIEEVNWRIHNKLDLADTERLQLLLNLGVDVNILDKNERTPLMRAVIEELPLSVKFLLEKNADVHLTDACGNTALHYAKTPHIARLLMKAGALLTVTNLMGKTPLDGEEGASFNLQSFIDYPLHTAFAFNDLPEVLYWVREGCTLDQEDSKGLKPADHCKDEQRRIELVKQVTKRIHQNAKAQKFTFHYLAKLCHLLEFEEAKQKLLKLLEKKKEINEQNKRGKTPLMLAVRCPPIVSFLLQKGANPAIIDHEGNTALHYAVMHLQPESWSLLVAEGANPYCKNKKGETPLKLASTIEGIKANSKEI